MMIKTGLFGHGVSDQDCFIGMLVTRIATPLRSERATHSEEGTRGVI